MKKAAYMDEIVELEVEKGLINVIMVCNGPVVWANFVIYSLSNSPTPKNTVYVHIIQCTIEELQHQEADLEAQMKEQCDDNKVLLNKKMARDMEIAAYRSV